MPTSFIIPHPDSSPPPPPCSLLPIPSFLSNSSPQDSEVQVDAKHIVKQWNDLTCFAIEVSQKDIAEPLANEQANRLVKDECSGHESSDCQELSRECSDAEWDNIVTVMIRNVPRQYNQDILVELMNKAGFQGSYDFVYLPINVHNLRNRGYAFVNFISPDVARLFKAVFEQQPMDSSENGKDIWIHPAAIQGYEANYYHSRSNNCSASQPLFLRAENTCLPPYSKEVNVISNLGSVDTSWHKEGLVSSRALDDECPRKIDIITFEQWHNNSANHPDNVTTNTKKPEKKLKAQTIPPLGDSTQSRICLCCGSQGRTNHTFCIFCGALL